MKQQFSNFSYALTDSKLEKHKEVVVTFTYANESYHRYIFIKEGKGVKYIEEAKRIIKKEIADGTLLNNTSKENRKKKKPLLIALVSLFAASSVTLAGLFTWKCLAPNVDPGGGGGGDDPVLDDLTEKDFKNAITMKGIKTQKYKNEAYIKSIDEEYAYSEHFIQNNEFTPKSFHEKKDFDISNDFYLDDYYVEKDGDTYYEYLREDIFGLYNKRETESDSFFTPDMYISRSVEDGGTNISKFQYSDFIISKDTNKYIAESNKKIKLGFIYEEIEMDTIKLEFDKDKRLTTVTAGSENEYYGYLTVIKDVISFNYDNFDPVFPKVGNIETQLGKDDVPEGTEFESTLQFVYPFVSNENVPVQILVEEEGESVADYIYDEGKIEYIDMSKPYDKRYSVFFDFDKDNNKYYKYKIDENLEYQRSEITSDDYYQYCYTTTVLEKFEILDSSGDFSSDKWGSSKFTYFEDSENEGRYIDDPNPDLCTRTAEFKTTKDIGDDKLIRVSFLNNDTNQAYFTYFDVSVVLPEC